MEQHSIVEGLKQQMGLSQDVNPQAASSPALDATGPNLQGGDAALPPQAPSAAPSEVQPQTMGRGRKPEEVIAMKEQALADAKAKLEETQKRLQEQEATTSRLVDQFAQLEEMRAAATVQPPEPKEVPRPDNWGEMDGNQQAAWTASREAEKVTARMIKQEREAQQRALAPILQRHNEMADRVEREAVMKRYPRFSFERYGTEIDRLRAGQPALRLDEAVAIVSAQNDPSMLLPAERQPPVTLPVVPSPSTAAAGPGQQIMPTQTGPTVDQLVQAAGRANIGGSTSQGKSLLMEALRQKGMVDTHGNHLPIPSGQRRR